MNHKEPVDDVRNSYHLTYQSKEGYETLQKQWVPFIIAYHPISHAERVPEIWYFVCHWRNNNSRNDKGVNHKGLVDAIGSSSQLSYAS